jgi:type I restriction enzyme S subunit
MVAIENKIQRYDTYKNSGVAWLGKIPEHWECIRMKHLYKDVSIKNRPNELLSSVTQDRGVIPRDWIESRMVMPSGNLESFKYIAKEDFAISLRSFEGGLEYCYHDGIISPAYTVLKKKKDNLSPFFYKYLFKSISFISELQTSVVGIREGKNISYSELSYSFLPIPPLQEQTQIAQFLDDKTSKIDTAIGIKEQQIQLLKERKQILIHKAVTRGLDDKVALKDSGVEWIGDIPVHWEVKKLFGLCDFVRGNSTFSKDELLNTGNYVALQYGKTYKVDEIDNNYNFYVNDEFYKESQIVNFGDTILVSTSETIEDLGHSAYYNRNDLGLLGGEQMVLKPNQKKLNGHYLYFFSKMFSIQLKKYATGIKVFRFNVNNIKTIYISVPPLSEQKEISAYIETASQKIETAIALKQQEIEKLKEYKGSLINGVVTGKVRVC